MNKTIPDEIIEAVPGDTYNRDNSELVVKTPLKKKARTGKRTKNDPITLSSGRHIKIIPPVLSLNKTKRKR